MLQPSFNRLPLGVGWDAPHEGLLFLGSFITGDSLS